MGVGVILSILWLIFLDNQIIYYFIGIIALGYICFREIYVTKRPWGVVMDQARDMVDNIVLRINRGNKLYSCTVSDYAGKYSFGSIDDGTYNLSVKGNNYKIQASTRGYYGGGDISVRNNGTERPINIIIDRK
ncbi:hypothetical protein KJ855_02025, partial [Patescibacteria group bacterium]|nr:hypothetical protein [Patescibacteria group bacterium]